MLPSLDDADTIHERGRRTLIGAAMFASAVLAPLVVNAFLELFSHGARDPRYLVPTTVWAALLAAILARVALIRGWPAGTTPRVGALVARCMLAGVFYPSFFFVGCAPFVDGPPHVLQLVLACLLVLCVLPALAAIVSAPIGAAFGALFSTGIVLARDGLGRPAHDTLARTRGHAAVMLLAAAFVAVALTERVEGWCAQLFGAAAQVRYLLVPTPLLVASFVLAVASVVERRRIARVANEIVAGTHPRWIADTAHDENASLLPLRESDYVAKERAVIRARPTGVPYRSVEAPLALVGK